MLAKLLAAASVLTLLALFALLALPACQNPVPLDPSSSQFGKKPCEANDDCASHFCGPDHRCG